MNGICISSVATFLTSLISNEMDVDLSISCSVRVKKIRQTLQKCNELIDTFEKH